MVTAVCNSAGHPFPAHGHSDAIMGLHAFSSEPDGAGTFPTDTSLPGIQGPPSEPALSPRGPSLLRDHVSKRCSPQVGPYPPFLGY